MVKEPVNITSQTCNAAMVPAGKGNFKRGGWKKIIETGKKETVLLLNRVLMGFAGGAEDEKYLAENRKGDPKKAAKLPGGG